MTPEELRSVYDSVGPMSLHVNGSTRHDAGLRAVFEAGARVQWIPVAERLPPINVPVLTHWELTPSGFYECPESVALYNGEIWHNPDDAEDYYSPPHHWMPLPAAPLAKVEG